MNEVFEKILERLEELRERYVNQYNPMAFSVKECMEIVQEVSEEYKDKSNIIDGLKIFLQEKFNYCAEQAEMNLESECNSEIASYFRDRKELYLDRANIYGEVMREIDRLAVEYNNGWIPCSERLPKERDWYLAVFEEVDTGFIGIPYIADYLMGSHTKFTTEDGWIIRNCSDREDESAEYYKNLRCVAWQPLPQPYKESD